DINAQTQVFAVLGDPVAHSLSPLIHNKAFRRVGINAVYVPMRVPRSDLAATVKAYERIGVKGYSVTIPHKEAAANLATERDEPVEWTKAANPLVHGDDGFTAYNTDYQGVIAALRDNVPDHPPPPNPERPLAGRTALILGAGGIARAAAFALQREGVVVTVTNRTVERAERLAGDARCKLGEGG